jgi:hypothetical protein
MSRTYGQNCMSLSVCELSLLLNIRNDTNDLELVSCLKLFFLPFWKLSISIDSFDRDQSLL